MYSASFKLRRTDRATVLLRRFFRWLIGDRDGLRWEKWEYRVNKLITKISYKTYIYINITKILYK